MKSMNSDEREIWIQRHGPQTKVSGGGIWGLSAVLTPEGEKLMQAVQHTHYEGITFDLCMRSGVLRAVQSAMTVYPQGGWVSDERLAPNSKTLEDWDRLFASGEPLDTLEQLEEANELLFNIHLRQLETIANDVLLNVGSGQRGLIVTHNPFTGMLLGLLGVEGTLYSWPLDELFPKGGGMVLRYRGEMLISVTPLAPPTI